ncbi:MAG: Uma2 family endonuclease [Labilithrix sp.]|nr:Uma2 family endonuclease [Labilithrix sp.]MCW5816855.1 Uma2 family endonuclease [Labilithrix sp.]
MKRATAEAISTADVLYPTNDDMGEHEIQRLIAELLRPLLARFLAAAYIRAHVGADQFIYWEEGNPLKRIAPDVYVLPGVDPDIVIPSWKTWETGVKPSFALEVASGDVTKDYDDGPAAYAELGVKELVVFDPHATPRSRRRRRFQVFRRIRNRGLVRVEVNQGDRVRSKVLGAWLVAVGSGDNVRLRLGLGPAGDELFPTEAEAERAAKELALADNEQLRAEREQERAARLAAEEENLRLRALLDKRRR